MFLVHYSSVQSNCFIFRTLTVIIIDIQHFRIFTLCHHYRTVLTLSQLAHGTLSEEEDSTRNLRRGSGEGRDDPSFIVDTQL